MEIAASILFVVVVVGVLYVMTRKPKIIPPPYPDTEPVTPELASGGPRERA